MMTVAELAPKLSRYGVRYVLAFIEHHPHEHYPHDPSQERIRHVALVKPVADFCVADIERSPWFNGLIDAATPLALSGDDGARLRTALAVWCNELIIDWERGAFFSLQGQLAWDLGTQTLLVHTDRRDSRGDNFETARFRYRHDGNHWVKVDEVLASPVGG